MYHQTYHHQPYSYANAVDPVNQELEKLITLPFTEKHVCFLYHMKNTTCEREKNGRHEHCKKNPNCFLSMGEEEREKQQSQDLVLKRMGPNPSVNLRGETDRFTGLKNLGSTCYMNSFIQCLYANTNVRRGLYQWDEAKDPDEVMWQIKLLFSHLQGGTTKNFTPTQFAGALGLSPSLQQDAQEFFKLLLGLLETKFAKCSVGDLQTLIKDEFGGRSAYETKCLSCNRVSKQEEEFYDISLHIEGKRTLQECFEDAFKPERIDYFCEGCGKKDGQAERAPHIITLPPVLNITLMRFIYDKETANKKKVMGEIEFPLRIDMQRYMEKSSTDHVMEGGDDAYLYQLTAVICHCGPSANGGHYICYVFDYQTSKWWKFDDEHVTICTYFPFEKKSPYDYTMSLASGYPKDPTPPKFESPYMLIYERINRPRTTEPELSASVLSHVEAETGQLFESIDKYSAEANKQIELIDKEKAEFSRIFKLLPAKLKSRDFYWISAEWLRKWIKGDEPIGPIDNSKLLCKHNKVNIDETNKKRISTDAWAFLHAQYGGGPALTYMDCCLTCCKKFYDKKYSKKVNLKAKDTIVRMCIGHYGSTGYYISRNWFESWRSSTPDEKIIPNMTFDIVCPHSNLIPDHSARQSIPVEAWNWLRIRFNDKDLVEFPITSRPCEQCKESERQQAEMQRKMRIERSAEKNKFYMLHDYKLSPKLRLPTQGQSYCLISTVWVKKWFNYVDMLTKEHPGPIDNKPLMCEHDKIIYNVGNVILSDSTDPPFYYVQEHQYLALIELYGGAPDIKFICVASEALFVDNTMKRRLELSHDPPHCEPCVARRIEAYNDSLIHFHDRDIVIKEGTEPYMHYAKANVRVSHNTTVETLKAAVFQHLNIPVFQQLLFFGEEVLSEKDAILKDFGIKPGDLVTVVKLSEQQALETLGNVEIDDYYRKNPEVGFQDSILAQGAAPQGPSPRGRDPMDATATNTQPATATSNNNSPAQTSLNATLTQASTHNNLNLNLNSNTTTTAPAPTTTGATTNPPPVTTTPQHPHTTSTTTPAVHHTPAAAAAVSSKEWACSACTYLNNETFLQCDMCGTKKDD
eukprot:TRINITY_DN851_c2_g1_i2.p1 TRINITY_DN851_c2_g1~~TRINITY_DN851_c2_g1_i2.p1  ORF type:complete len:1086 (-),score=209.31 TRINITY_DN851_c2_g1_i2:28-3285(-)